jgi:hypothetical protein
MSEPLFKVGDRVRAKSCEGVGTVREYFTAVDAGCHDSVKVDWDGGMRSGIDCRSVAPYNLREQSGSHPNLCEFCSKPLEQRGMCIACENELIRSNAKLDAIKAREPLTDQAIHDAAVEFGKTAYSGYAGPGPRSQFFDGAKWARDFYEAQGGES